MAITFTAFAGGNDFDYLYPAAHAGNKIVRGSFDLGTYATGGIAVAITDIDADCASIVDIIFSSTGKDYVNSYEYDKANGKIVAFVAATGAQVANAVDLSGSDVKATVICT